MVGIVVLAAVFSAKAAASLPPLIEARRTNFETPYAPVPAYGHGIAAMSGDRVAYAVSGADLFVLDTETGVVLDMLDLRPYGDPTNFANVFEVALAEGAATSRLLLWRIGSRDLRAFDLSDPVHPALTHATTFSGEVNEVVPLPGGRRVLVRQFGGVDLLDLDVWTVTYSFAGHSGPYGTYFAAAAAGGTADRGVAAMADWSVAGNVYRYAVTVYEVSDAAGVRELTSFDPGFSPAGLFLDREGDVVVLEKPTGYGYPDARATYEIRRVADGSLAATVDPAGHGIAAGLAEGGGARALVVADPGGIDVVDLADPAAPRAVGRIEAAMSEPTDYYRVPGAFVASATGPLVFAAAIGERQVLAVDVRTATVAGRLPTGDAPPIAVALREGGGTRDLVVPVARARGSTVYVPGGTQELQFADATNPTSMTPTGRLLRNQPRTIDGFGAVGGGWGVALDAAQNSIALIRLRDGTVADVTGLAAPVDRGGSAATAALTVRDPFALVWGPSGFEVFRVESDRLARVRGRRWESSRILAADLRADGTVITLGYDFDLASGTFTPLLRTILPDGREGTAPLDGDETTLALSPRGDLALLGALPYSYPIGRARIFDLTDALAPVLAWEGVPGFASGAFDPSGSRLFATVDSLYQTDFTGALYDARLGTPLGPASPPVSEFYYHGLGTLFGTGADTKAVVWKWTFVGWETALFDLGGTTPVLREVLPEFFGVPAYLARDGGGWYELQSGQRATDFLIADADGTQTFALQATGGYHDFPSNVRHGFFATAGFPSNDRSFVSLWRDTALNRAPVARAGGGRTVECDGPGGTTVSLAGNGSTDPDSTPGTNDDITSFEWAIDGGEPRGGASIEASLDRGSHDVALTVTDALGAQGSDLAIVTIDDSLPPEIGLSLEPFVAGGAWAHQFVPHGSLRDLCDGELGAPAERLLLPGGAAAAPVSSVSGAERTIEVLRAKDGSTLVRLVGSDEALLAKAWHDAAASGGFAMVDAAPVALVLAPGANGRDAGLVARYEIDAAGRLTGATAFGAAEDLALEATGADTSGHGAATSLSLRSEIARICAEEPWQPVCLAR